MGIAIIDFISSLTRLTCDTMVEVVNELLYANHFININALFKLHKDVLELHGT